MSIDKDGPRFYLQLQFPNKAVDCFTRTSLENCGFSLSARLARELQPTGQCALKLVSTAFNFETSIMSRPVNTTVFPVGRSTPGR